MRCGLSYNYWLSVLIWANHVLCCAVKVKGQLYFTEMHWSSGQVKEEFPITAGKVRFRGTVRKLYSEEEYGSTSLANFGPSHMSSGTSSAYVFVRFVQIS